MGALNINCIIHGSFRRHYGLIKDIANLFSASGIKVIAPEITDIIGETDGFAHLKTDNSDDPRLTELLYLRRLSELGISGFSYYVNPDGRLGTSSSYELAIDQLTNTRTIFMAPLNDHPAYIPLNSVWQPEALCNYIQETQHYPLPIIPQDERGIYEMLQDLALPGSVIAVGAIIVDNSDKRYSPGQERDVLLVETHKWGGRFSVVGGRVRRNELLSDSLQRHIIEEIGLSAHIEESLGAFDKIDSGYFKPGEQRVFADNVAAVSSRRVELNEEAESYVWIPPAMALRELNLEPNARRTLEIYVDAHKRVA